MEKLFIQIMGTFVSVISPTLRDSLTAWVKDLEAKAKETPSPFDDMFVDVLKKAVGVE